MAFFLLKTEPDAFSWADQVARGAAGEPWTGVRNHQAKAVLASMTVGDRAFLYHTGDERRVMGVVETIGGARPDPTDPAWICVDVKAVAPLKTPVTLAAIKADPTLVDMVLVKNSRLSVQPVTEAQWTRVLELGGGLAG